MAQRPLSLTIAAWYLILAAAVTVAGLWFQRDNPLVRQLMAQTPVPVPVQLAVAAAGCAIGVIVGLGILGRRGWARWLFVGWLAASTVYSLLVSPLKSMILPGLIVQALVLFFLFRKPAGAWFAGAGRA